MADNELDLRLKAIVDAGNSAKTIGELKKSIRELENLTVEYGDKAPAEMAKISAEAGKLNDKFKEVKEKTRALSGEGFENMTNSLGLMRSQVKSLDFKGARDSLLLFKQSISGTNLKGLTSDAASFGKELLSIGKGFLLFTGFIAVIGLIIENFDKLKSVGGAIGALFTGIGNIIDSLIRAAKNLLDFLKLTDFAGEESRKKALENNALILKSTEEKYDKEILLARLAGTSVVELEEKKRQAQIKSYQEKINLINKEKAAGSKLTDDQLKDIKESQEKIAELRKARLVEFVAQVEGIRNADKSLKDQIEQTKIKLLGYEDSNDARKEIIRREYDLENAKLYRIQKENERIAEEWRLEHEQIKRDAPKIAGEKLGLKEKTDQQFAYTQAIEYQKQIDNSNEKLSKLAFFSDQRSMAQKDIQIKNINFYTDKLEQLKRNYGIDISGEVKDYENRLSQTLSNIKELSIKVENEAAKMIYEDDKAYNEASKILNQYNKDLSTQIGLNNQLAKQEIKKVDKTQDVTDLNEKIKKQEELFNTAKSNLAEYNTGTKEFDDSLMGLYSSYNNLLKLFNQNELGPKDKEIAKKAETYKAMGDAIRSAVLSLSGLYFTFGGLNKSGKMANDINEQQSKKVLDDLKVKSYHDQIEEENKIYKKQSDAKDEAYKKEVFLTKLQIENKVLLAKKLADIDIKYTQESYERQMAHTKKITDLKQMQMESNLQYASFINQQASSIMSSIFQTDVNTSGKNEKQLLAARKRQFNANKAIGVANVTISTAEALMRQWKDVPAPLVPVLQGLIAAAGAASIAQILSTKFDEGGSSGGKSGAFSGAFSGGSSISSGGAPSPFVGPSVFSTGFTQQTAHGGPNFMRVSVLESDITKVQNRVKVTEQRSSVFGG